MEFVVNACRGLKKNRIIIIAFALMVGVLGFGESVFAATITVDGIAELNTAISNANAGDIIILADGTYTDQGTINFDCRSVSPAPTEGNELTVRAQTPGSVIITGGSSNMNIMGDHLILEGFYFKDIVGNGILLSLMDADYCRVTNCKFEGVNKVGGVIEVRGLSATMSVFYGSSTNNRIDHCTFEGNRRIQIENFIVDGENYAAPDLGNINNKYDHNIFKSHIDASQEEAFQIGRGSTVWAEGTRGYPSEFATDAYIAVEYNLFEEYHGDNELISSKSSSNIIRYNIIKNCNGAITLRGGNNSVVEGNYFLAEAEVEQPLDYYRGVVVHGTNHKILNNYIEGFSPGSGNGQIFLSHGNSANHPDVSNVLIAGNSIKNSRFGVYMEAGDAGDPVEATNCTIINNIAESTNAGGGAAMFNNRGSGHTFISNLAYCPSCDSGGSINGVTDTGEFILTNQKTGLLVNWYSPSSYTDGTYNANVIDDIEGQTRANPPDIGCDEDDGTIIRPMIGLDDVGVQWGNDTTPPTRSNPHPNGTLSSGIIQTNISLTTDKQAICRYSNVSGTNYTDISFNFTYTNSTNHSTPVSGLENGETYTFYVRCNSTEGYVNVDDFNISFSVDGHKADLNDDGIINMPELMVFIGRWKTGDGVTKQEVGGARDIWFIGGVY
ncbi:MAG: chondroitinase-B domain-containing protein [Candidatus Altiarchaeota archaeon]|nr:chondroitinase-B domain-containing protein [Candidatus Altiarchaeota archaeon]